MCNLFYVLLYMKLGLDAIAADLFIQYSHRFGSGVPPSMKFLPCILFLL